MVTGDLIPPIWRLFLCMIYGRVLLEKFINTYILYFVMT